MINERYIIKFVFLLISTVYMKKGNGALMKEGYSLIAKVGLINFIYLYNAHLYNIILKNWSGI